MSGAVFLSRILGLVREQVFAFFFGASMVTDAFVVAFRIPNLLRDLFAEGALSAAFVTVFSRTEGEERARKMAKHVLIVQTAVVGVICALIYLFADSIVLTIAPDFAQTEGKVELTTRLTQYLAPFLFFASSAALAMGILNSRGYFFVPALGSAAFNFGSIIIGGGLAYSFRDQGSVTMITGFTFGALIGGFLQWLVQWPLLIAKGFSPLRAWHLLIEVGGIRKSFRDDAIKKILFLMGPSVLAVAAVQINVFVNTVIASELKEGSISWLSFAYRLLHFPLGVFGVALSVAALPSLAKLWSRGETQAFNNTLKSALRYTWVLALGSAAGLIAFREPLLTMIFEHGQFERSDTLETAAALAAFALALPALNSTKIFVQVFYALDKVWIPSTVSLLLVVSHYFLASYFAAELAHVGIALATAMTSLANALILALIVGLKGFKLFDFESFKVLTGSLAGVGVILFADVLGLPRYLLQVHDESFALFVAMTLLFIGVFGSAYMLCATLPSQEMRGFMGRLMNRFKAR